MSQHPIQVADLQCLVVTLIFSFIPVMVAAQFSTGEQIVYSYFLNDPSSTIHISWISKTQQAESFQYKRKESVRWTSNKITRTVNIPGSNNFLHEVQLKGLRQGSAFDFIIGDSDKKMSFRTLPNQLTEPVNFVNGGDLFHNAAFMIPTTTQAAKKDPYFAVIGGDWAYADGDSLKVGRWFRLFEIWQQQMITSDGFIVPFVPVIGNHEVQGGYTTDPGKSLLYYTFFDKPGKRAYYTLDVGDYLSLVLLDSHHTATIDGPQKIWLQNRLAERKNVQHVFPAYHVPAWPSFRPYDNHYSALVREHWVPLFERNGITLSFENHDHTLKRTKPLKNNRVQKDGIVYIGDGSWGVTTRKASDATERWYIETVTDDHHFWHIIILKDLRVIEAYDQNGILLDSFQQIFDPKIIDQLVHHTETPGQLLLAQNFPNPFNPSTLISFSVPENSDNRVVRLDLFNIRGQLISTLVNEPLNVGSHSFILDTRKHNLSSGQYIYRLRFGNQTITKQMQLIK